MTDCVCESLHFNAASENEPPDCKKCPTGAVCTIDFSCALGPAVQGAINVTTCQGAAGTWSQDIKLGAYILTSCPSGYSLLSLAKAGSTDLQRCEKCNFRQYIINPDTDDCQPCPPGLECRGDDAVRSRVANASWVRNGSIYRLVSCPTGYSVSSQGAGGRFDATVQQCTACGKGEECVSAECTVCSLCRPGFYKASVSTDACLPCPAGTYREMEGAQELGACMACQVKASTMGATGQSSPSACVCDVDYYPAATAASTCQTCPRGAMCADRSCGLHGPRLFSCTDGGSIVGNWSLDGSTGLYELTSCPAGYSSQTTAKTGSEDLQECKPCPEGQYILQPRRARLAFIRVGLENVLPHTTRLALLQVI